ncbi:MAG: type II secretion system F family protein [Acidimicrobiia bacterium]|nr:type II secretion system F family protein [Acidimicrobiia bacterium]
MPTWLILPVVAALSITAAMAAATASRADVRERLVAPNPATTRLGGMGGHLLVRVRRLPFVRGGSDARVVADLPEALDSIARSLRTGRSLRQAVFDVDMSGPIAGDFDTMRRELDAGRELRLTIAGWAERRRLSLVELAVAALLLTIDAGGTGAGAIDRVAATVRDRRSIEREVAALSSQARASAVVIGLLPVAFLVLAITADPATSSFLFTTPAGILCLTAGLGLDVVAAVWMHRIARSVKW